MTTKQPDPLRLAAYLRQFNSPKQHGPAEAIERLHAENERLKAQLEAVGASAQAPVIGPLAKRAIGDAIRGAYDLGYSDARNARAVPGDAGPAYVGRDVEADHGSALAHRLSQLATIAARAPNPERSDSAPSPIGAPDTVSETAPERIWLQIDPHGADIERAEPFPADDDGVTWCRDSAGGVEVAYVRADLAGRDAGSSEERMQ